MRHVVVVVLAVGVACLAVMEVGWLNDGAFCDVGLTLTRWPEVVCAKPARRYTAVWVEDVNITEALTHAVLDRVGDGRLVKPGGDVAVRTR